MQGNLHQLYALDGGNGLLDVRSTMVAVHALYIIYYVFANLLLKVVMMVVVAGKESIQQEHKQQASADV